MITLGIDTSNYTTSAALYDSVSGEIIQRKQLLPVKKGEKGLRQSDAVFHHTQQLSPLIEKLFGENRVRPDAIGVSWRPRDAVGSYMPCFTVGLNTARCLAAALDIPLFRFSHQAGHIAAALYSSGNMDLMDGSFIAFHVSGGTTEALHITPSEEFVLSAEIIGGTSDLNAGQCVDRCGVMLGFGFPCGRELERCALSSENVYNPRVSVREGFCSLSGLQNQLEKMKSSGEAECDICRYCLDYIAVSMEKVSSHALSLYPGSKIIYAGGVMSNSIIRQRLSSGFDCAFAQPDFSCDNAAGAAILACRRGLLL